MVIRRLTFSKLYFLLGMLLVFLAMEEGHLAPDAKLSELIAKTEQVVGTQDLAAALMLAEETLVRARQLKDPDATAFVTALHNKAYLLFLLNEEPELSTKLWREAVAVLIKSDMQQSELWFTVSLNFAAHEYREGDKKRAVLRLNELAASSKGLSFEAQVLQSAATTLMSNGNFIEGARLANDLVARFPKQISQNALNIYKSLGEMADTAFRQDKLDAVIAINDLRIVIFRAYLQVHIDDPDSVVRNILSDSHFKAYQLNDFAIASSMLGRWINTGTPSADERRDFESLGASFLERSQLSEIAGERPNVTLDFAGLALRYAEILYLPEDIRYGEALRTMGHAQETAGLSADAVDSMLQALSVFEKNPDGRLSQHLVMDDLGRILHSQGKFDLAEQFYARATESYNEASKNGGELLSEADQAINLSNRALLSLDKEEPDIAIEKLDQARFLHEKARQSGGEFKWNDETFLAKILHLSALAKIELDQRSTALDDLNQAIKIIEQFFPKMHPQKAVALANIADALLVLDEKQRPRELLNKAVEINRMMLAPNIPSRIDVEFKLALLNLLERKTQQADELLEAITAARMSPAYRDKLSGAAIEYEVHAWNALSSGEPQGIETAFKSLQWTQMASAAAALSGAQKRLSASDPNLSGLIRQQQDLTDIHRLNTNRLQISLASEGIDNNQVLELRKRISETEKTLDIVDHKLAENGFDKLGFANINPVTIKAIQSMLDDNEALVTFLLPSIKTELFSSSTQSSNRVIAITRHTVKVGIVREKSRNNLLKRIVDFRCAMAVADLGCATIGKQATRGSFSIGGDENDSANSFPLDIAHALYQDLFGDIEDVVLTKENLIIIPPPDLLSLPFQALVTKDMPNTPLRDAAWMVRRHAISVVPSITSFAGQRTRNRSDRKKTKSFLGVGDPIIGNSNTTAINCANVEVANLRAAPASQTLLNDANALIADVGLVAALPRLADTACELQSVKQAIGGDDAKILLGENATESEIKSLADRNELKDYRIIAFATHGLIAGEVGAVEPALVLTPPANGSERDDGLLTASEVATLRLDADLVILSACNTAAGEDINAEGLSGLARAFFHAGARSILVTHWSVYSEAAVEITTSMFDVLKEQESLKNSQALRQSILNLLESDEATNFQVHPSYWAAFAIVSDS